MTIRKTAQQYRDGKATPLDVVKKSLQRIRDRNSDMNAFLEITDEAALQQAEILTVSEGDPLLKGIPASIKDVILTKGVKTTASSKILEDYVASYDATVVARLKAQGMIMLGKNNCDEFAMGASNEQSAFGAVKNPWDASKVPGGSSGGSAAAVSAGLVPYSIGTDTGGSLRQPASFTGIVGLKPTYGRVSRYGLIALCSSFDQAGPLTQTVEDAAIVLQAIAGQDEHDMTSVPDAAPNYVQALQQGVRGLTIGIPKEYFIDGMDKDVERAVRQAIMDLEHAGAKIKEVSLPHTKYAVPTYYVILPAEVSSNLARYDGMRYGLRAQNPDAVIFKKSDSAQTAVSRLWDTYVTSRGVGFGPEPKRRIMIGTFVLSSGYADAFYKQAQKVRELIRRDFDDVFKTVDCLVAPTTPTTAFDIGENVDDPVKMYLADIFTCPANIAGVPAISLPCGFSKGLPIGLQIIGKALGEDTILRAAYAYEQSHEWKDRHPAI